MVLPAGAPCNMAGIPIAAIWVSCVRNWSESRSASSLPRQNLVIQAGVIEADVDILDQGRKRRALRTAVSLADRSFDVPNRREVRKAPILTPDVETSFTARVWAFSS